MGVRRKYIRALVEEILDEHKVSGKPVPVEAIAESFGATIRKEPTQADLSGFLLRDPTSNLIVIGVNSSQSFNRQRFTIGHELGHLLLHEGERVHVDRSGYGLRFRREPDDPNEAPEYDETEANVFAAELLMPKRMIEADLAAFNPNSLSGDRVEEIIEELAEKYEVSTQALTYRLANLRYIEL